MKKSITIILLLGCITSSCLSFCPDKKFLHPSEIAGNACYNKDGNVVCDSNLDDLCQQEGCELQYGGYETYNCGHANYHNTLNAVDKSLVNRWIPKCCFDKEPERSGCLGKVESSFSGECTYDKVMSVTKGLNCSDSDMFLYLRVSNSSRAKDVVDKLCSSAFDHTSDSFFEFSDISQAGYQFDREFMNGGSDWNNAFKPDITRIKLTEQKISKKKGITFPEYLYNFNTSKSCGMKAVMCCWTADSSNAGAGTCDKAAGCQDAEPEDNTDICHVTIKNSPLASHTRSGVAIYPDDIEGNANCMGFTWKEGDASDLYKGNLLFEVAMNEGLKKNGYTRSVPHAPMCACVEQMPIVSRADCKSLEATDNWAVYADSQSGLLGIKHSSVDITYGNCNGTDLATYYDTVYPDTNGISSAISSRITGVCKTDKPIGAFKKELRVKWVKVAGKGIFADSSHTEQLLNGTHTSFTRTELERLWSKAGLQILFRRCKDCYDTHQYIYYKRYDTNGLPPNVDVLYDMKEHWQEYENNTWQTDFHLYSTLKECLVPENPWKSLNFGIPGMGFARDSGHYHQRGGQWNTWDTPLQNKHFGQRHVGFYVAVPPNFQVDEVVS